jgi:hypothetical protein
MDITLPLFVYSLVNMRLNWERSKRFINKLKGGYMEWIKINKETETPDTEVLAYGNQGEMLFGWLGKDEDNGDWTCESEGVILEDCTHYLIPIKPKK